MDFREMAEKIVRGPGWADNYISVEGDGIEWDKLIDLFTDALCAAYSKGVESKAQLLEALIALRAEHEFIKEDSTCDHSVGICWCSYHRALEMADGAITLCRPSNPPPKIW